MPKLMTFTVSLSLAALAACAANDENDLEHEVEVQTLPLLGGGYSASCWNIGINFSAGRQGDAWLNATCRKSDGSQRDSAVNLDLHIENINGDPRTNAGWGFSHSCPDVGMTSGRWMRVKCNVAPPAVGWKVSNVDLDACIANYDGQLTWVGCDL